LLRRADVSAYASGEVCLVVREATLEGVVSTGDGERLRILIANEDQDELQAMTTIVTSLGHVVVGPSSDPAEVGRVARDEQPDVALVGLGRSTAHALELISRIVHEVRSPVIAILNRPDRAFVGEAARRGIFACVACGAELDSAIEISLRRSAELRDLEGAFGRRAAIERAKGILMERFAVDERQVFELLRRHSQRTGRRLADLAEALNYSHLLLLAPAQRSQARTDRVHAQHGA
jgi:AmiR/NasT family two-component response regulator